MSARSDDQTRLDGAASHPSGEAPEPAEPLSEEQRNRAAPFLTTEHFTLQTARAATIAKRRLRIMCTLAALIASAQCGMAGASGFA